MIETNHTGTSVTLRDTSVKGHKLATTTRKKRYGEQAYSNMGKKSGRARRWKAFFKRHPEIEKWWLSL
jgi:hypothetical protein